VSNILTISPYKEFSSVGEKSFNLINCLNAIDGVQTVNVHYSSQEQSNEKINIPFEINEDKIDACIMYLDPEKFVKTKYNSIGVYEPSTSGNYMAAGYTKYLDSLIVYSEKQKSICKNLNENILVVKPSVNFNSKLNPTKSIDRTVKFYIPSVEKTANIDRTVKAYFKTFDSSDNVTLGILSDNPNREIQRFDKIKNECSCGGGDTYPEIVLFTDIKDMHEQCNCSIDVDSSYTINTSSLVSLKFGNPVICLETSSIQEWLPEDVCYRLSSHEDLVVDEQRKFICAGEKWQMFSIIDMSNMMRSIYEDRVTLREKQDRIVKGGHQLFDTVNSVSSLEEALCF
tara:strand:- start:762 stop:1787 length:1026 start_codon:yes stop_codon:yes gene_type:complete